MVYTFKINDVSAQSSSIINMLLSLSKDYEFLEAAQEDEPHSEFQLEELDRRYEDFQKNPINGRKWEEVKNDLLKI